MNKVKDKNLKWWLRNTSYGLLFIFILTFTFMKTENIFTNMKLSVDIENTELSINTIRGKAPNAVYISLNGREIFIDKKGNFEEKIAVINGLQTVTIEAQDKFGHKSDKEIEIYHKEKVEVALLK